MKGKVLILGANGFLGSHVTGWLAAKGYPLRLFDLGFHRSPQLDTAAEAEIVEGNFMNPADVSRALEGVDMVLHFISTTVPATSINNPMVEVETNVTASAKLLDLMVEKSVRFIGFPSSGGTIYGESNYEHREKDILRPSCPYGLGKALIEDIIHFYSDYRGISYQIWRISNAYGDTTRLHMMQGVIDAFLQKIKAGERLTLWGDGSAVRDFIFIDDLVAAIGGMIESGVKNQVVNIGSGVGSSIHQVLDVMRAVVGHNFAVDTVESYAGIKRALLNIEKINQLTGWQPSYTLETGIAEAWRRLTGSG
jgi:UDP-glucose 4-epimerase